MSQKSKTEFVENMFDSISGSYDKLNHLMSLDIDKTWRARALRHITDCTEPMQILDIACGTGDFSIEIAKHLPEGSHLIGLDLSEGMLEVMKDKVAKAGLVDMIETVHANCEAMSYPDNSFDRVTIAFGIRNFEHREIALREILRVLKPGGKLVILELSVPENKIIAALYKVYFTKIMPVIGGKISGDKEAYRYLPASVLAFPRKTQWMDIMKSCGFSAVTHKAFSLGICRMYTGQKTI